jgi:hypothetical protein
MRKKSTNHTCKEFEPQNQIKIAEVTVRVLRNRRKSFTCSKQSHRYCVVPE